MTAAGRSSSGDPADGVPLRRSRSAVCAMPGIPGAAPAFQGFAYEVARRWALPDTTCDTVALLARELVHDLAGFGIGLDTCLMLSADDTTVTLRVREAGRPRPPGRGAAAPGGRRPWRGDGTPSASRRPVGGTRLEARILLPEPERVARNA